MADLNEFTSTVQDKILDVIETGQKAVLESVKVMTDVVERVTPRDLNLPRLPGLDSLPEPKAALDAQFLFVEKVLASQRQFADAVVDAVNPLVEKVEASA